jgi:hypothetical protein
MTPQPGARFAASLDTTSKVITSLVMVGAAVAAGFQVWPLAGILLLTTVLSFAFAPMGYELRGRTLRITRPLGAREISLDGLQEARAAVASDFSGTIRLWGNGGLFGYYGLFRTSALGTCRWYLTNRRNAVVIVAANETVLVSPDDHDAFLSAVHEAGPVTTWQTEPGTRALDPGRGKPAWMVAIPAVVLLVVALIVYLAMTYSPGPPTYTLTHSGIEIHDRFYPVTVAADSVDVAHIRTVNISTDSEWRPVMRTNGFANGHYNSGWYRVSGGAKVRLYRADSRVLVLLPPKGDGPAVLCEVENPRLFIEELHRQWDWGEISR